MSGGRGAALPAERAETIERVGLRRRRDPGGGQGRAQLAAAVRLESTGSDQATIGAVTVRPQEWIVPAALPPVGRNRGAGPVQPEPEGGQV